MAVFTELTEADAQRVADACGLGAVMAILPVAAGSVNSNYMLKTDTASFFLRMYEEQETDGVAYEWALLDHLQHSAVPIPARLGGGRPGQLRAGGQAGGGLRVRSW